MILDTARPAQSTRPIPAGPTRRRHPDRHDRHAHHRRPQRDHRLRQRHLDHDRRRDARRLDLRAGHRRVQPAEVHPRPGDHGQREQLDRRLRQLRDPDHDRLRVQRPEDDRGLRHRRRGGREQHRHALVHAPGHQHLAPRADVGPPAPTLELTPTTPPYATIGGIPVTNSTSPAVRRHGGRRDVRHGHRDLDERARGHRRRPSRSPCRPRTSTPTASSSASRSRISRPRRQPRHQRDLPGLRHGDL